MYLLAALNALEDLNVFRRKCWFEKILVLKSHPHPRFK
jgi:hypothetical protein